MGIVIDIILIAILLLNILVGYKKGLINVIFSIFAFLIALVLTMILVKPISNVIIEKTDIDEKIKSTIIQNNKNQNENIDEDTQSSNLPKYIEKQVGSVAENAKNEATELIANTLTNQIVQIITGFALFIVIRILLVLLKFVTDSIAKIPIIKQFNKVGGLVYGIIKGIFMILVLLALIFLVISINGNGIIANAINNSVIAKFLYENNIIVRILFK